MGKPTIKEKLRLLMNWENWPFDVLYFPISFVWLWYGIKAKQFWFFTPVNPSLEFGGFEGGSKKEVYDQLPNWSYPNTIYVYPHEEIKEVLLRKSNAGINYPLVVKPSTGRAGILFRVLSNDDELTKYHSLVGEMYLLQEFVTNTQEYTVFHIRYPKSEKGIITGLVVKDFLQITGDGIKTVKELVLEHPVAKFKVPLMEKRHVLMWTKVLAKGENLLLNPSGNHNAGTKFVNLNHEIDERLCRVFDKISIHSGHFYFGRYDLKCTSLEDLKEGRNIKILEFNGAGAAIMHVFDRNMNYFSALKEIIRHWKHLYRIGRINNQNGTPYLNLLEGWKQMQKAKRNFNRMKKIDSLL